MNKAELVSKVADKTGFKKKDAEAALDAVVGTIEESLVAGDRSRKARKGRNPQKPEAVIDIPASKAPVFKAGKSLKDAVNK